MECGPTLVEIDPTIVECGPTLVEIGPTIVECGPTLVEFVRGLGGWGGWKLAGAPQKP